MSVIRFKITKEDLRTVANGGSIVKCWKMGNIDIDISLELDEVKPNSPHN